VQRIITTGIVTLLLLLALSARFPTTGATSAPALYSIAITNQTVSVAIHLDMVQNVTFFQRSFTLPILQVTAIGANSTGLADVVQSALNQTAPKARVSGLILQVASSAWSNTTGVQWLNESLSFDVSGVSTPRGDAAQFDLSWKSFAISSGYSLGGVEINRIGEKYLLGVASDLAAQGSGGQFIQFFYQVNLKPYDPAQFPEAVGNMSVLNFSSLATPVSKWTQTYGGLAFGESWSFRGSQGLGMAFMQQVQESGTTTTTEYGLLYNVAGSITVPNTARVAGDTITIIVSGFSESLMAGIVLSTVALLTGTTLFERRIQSKLPKSRKKGKS